MVFINNEIDNSISSSKLNKAKENKKKVIRKLTVAFFLLLGIFASTLYFLNNKVGGFYTYNEKLSFTIFLSAALIIIYFLLILQLKGKIKLNHFLKYFQVYDIFQFLAVIISIMLFLQMFIIKIGFISGSSMEPTLKPNDRIIVVQTKNEYKHNTIVVIDASKYNGKNSLGHENEEEEDEFYIKRVRAIEGDTLALREIENSIYYEILINGIALTDVNGEVIKIASQSNHYNNLKELEGVIPKGMYFLLGDNTKNSRDSRTFGFVEKDDILGSVHFRIWRKFGWVK